MLIKGSLIYIYIYRGYCDSQEGYILRHGGEPLLNLTNSGKEIAAILDNILQNVVPAVLLANLTTADDQGSLPCSKRLSRKLQMHSEQTEMLRISEFLR